MQQLTTSFADSVTKYKHETLETKFNEQIQKISELLIKQEQGEKIIIDLKKKLTKKIDIEELNKMEEKLITNTGKM